MTVVGSDRASPADGAPTAPSAPDAETQRPRGAATLAVIVVAMLVASLFRRGAFYPTDAFGIAAAATLLLVVALPRARDRSSRVVALALGALALWWFVRAVAAHRPAAFLPVGASFLGFLAAFVVVKALGSRDRIHVALTVLTVGALTAGSGLAGVLWHARPLAEHAGPFWQLAGPLTEPEASAAICALALLVGMALDLRAPLVRVALCVTLVGLIATQSHWSLLVLGSGVAFVPVGRWAEAVWPLMLGTLGGAAAVASASGHLSRWPAVLAIVALAGVAAAPVDSAWRRAGVRASTAGVIVVAACVAVLIVDPPGVSGPRQAADQSQTLAWSVGARAWRSAVVTGVGPPSVASSGQPVDTYPGLAPDTYLTVTADGGLIGIVLLAGAGAAVAAACRRRDLLSSCAAGAGTAFAVAGVVGVAWQIPAVALLGGCVTGLAAVATDGRGPPCPAEPDGPAGPREAAGPGEPDPPDAPARDPVERTGRRRPGAPVLWACALTGLVVVQLVVGSGEQAGGGLSHQLDTALPPTATPQAPARTILTGPDVTDPYMLTWRGRFYIYTSEGTSFLNVPVRVGSQPGQWGPPRDVLPHLPVWAERGETWAPDVHRVAGGWALYFTALLRGVVPYTHCIGAAFSDSPTGPFVPAPQPFICQLDHRGSIDARVFVEGTRLVMLWKSEDNANPGFPGPDQDGRTGIYAQGLSADGRVLLGTAVKILGPSEPWEATIVEAPDMVQAWGTYWLFFSGNWYYSPSYGIGVAACQTPFGPCSDLSPKPLIGSNLQGQGPGEESLFEDSSGAYVLYNPFRANDPGPVIPRPAVMARLGFTAQGPYLASP